MEIKKGWAVSEMKFCYSLISLFKKIRKSSQLERKGKNQIDISSKIKKLNRENEVIF